jgi:hypothetical protein
VCFAALRFRPHADRADRSTHAAARAARATSRSSAELELAY